MTIKIFPLVPLQMMDMLLQPTIPIIKNTPHKYQMIQRGRATKENSTTFLPDINKHMSHDWRNSQQLVSISAKSDDT